MGHYCDLPTMDAIDPAKVCDAGYVCIAGASTATPTDGTTGYICPAGHFCLAGSTRETPCLLGSYRGSTGATADTDCTTCTGGEQCNARGLSAPTGNDIICSAGYYCPDSLTTIVCERGYYCPQNVIDHVICEDGYYQPNEQQSSCLECPEGFYCPNDEGAGTVPDEALPCEAGSYCPVRSKEVTHCGVKYYMPFQGAQSSVDCIPCQAGFTCDSVTNTATPSVQCDQGYYCPAGGI